MKCNYKPNSWGWKLLRFLRRSYYKEWVLHNDELRAACEEKPSLCYEPDFVAERCREQPIQVVKTVRLRTSQAAELLKKPGDTTEIRPWSLSGLLMIVVLLQTSTSKLFFFSETLAL